MHCSWHAAADLRHADCAVRVPPSRNHTAPSKLFSRGSFCNCELKRFEIYIWFCSFRLMYTLYLLIMTAIACVMQQRDIPELLAENVSISVNWFRWLTDRWDAHWYKFTSAFCFSDSTFQWNVRDSECRTELCSTVELPGRVQSVFHHGGVPCVHDDLHSGHFHKLQLASGRTQWVGILFSERLGLRNKCRRWGVGRGNPRVRWEYRTPRAQPEVYSVLSLYSRVSPN